MTVSKGTVIMQQFIFLFHNEREKEKKRKEKKKEKKRKEGKRDVYITISILNIKYINRTWDCCRK